MIHNDVLRSVRYMLDISDNKVVEIIKLGGLDVTKEDVLTYLKKDEEETNARVLKKLKKLEETAKKCRKTDSDQMKELFETVCELEQEKVEKEVKDVKLQIRRAAEFLQNSFPGGAEVVLFEANLARSPALRSFLIEKSMDAEG